MSDPRDPAGAARRLAIWAAFLVLPLVLGAFIVPRVVAALRGGPPAAATPGGAGLLEALGPGQATALASGQGGQEAAPRRPDGPSTEQIEASREAELELAKAQEAWRRSQTIAPRRPTRDASGELVTPFEGFALSIESTPAGARVLLDGRDLGETPLLASVDCKAGASLELVLQRRGYQPHRQAIRCRADALVTLPIALRK